MGDRPIRYVLSGLAVLAGGAAQATVQTKVVEGSAANQVVLAGFDRSLGTLLSVKAEANYQTQAAYTNFTPWLGFDHAVSGTASFGGLDFNLSGNTYTTDYGSGRGAFVVKAIGSATWNNPADLAKFTNGTASLAGLGSISAPTPGYSSLGASSSLRYKITYTYEDGVSGAVPEPGTWALMAGGFVMVGVALRAARRRARGTGAPSEAPTAS